jgi:hypothetical protein
MRHSVTSAPLHQACLLLCAVGAFLGAPRFARAEPVIVPNTGEQTVAPSSPAAALPPAQPRAAEIRSEKPARVSVTTNKRSVVVSQVTGHTVVSSTGYAGFRPVALSSSVQDAVLICKSPCEFSAPPGTLELMLSNEGSLTRQEVFRFQSGDNYVHVDYGSEGLRVTGIVSAALGVGAVVSGSIMLLASSMMDDDNEYLPNIGEYGVPLLAGGASMLVGGLVLAAFNETSVESGPGSRPIQQAAKSRPVGLTLHGAF